MTVVVGCCNHKALPAVAVGCNSGCHRESAVEEDSLEHILAEGIDVVAAAGVVVVVGSLIVVHIVAEEVHCNSLVVVDAAEKHTRPEGNRT